MFLSAQDLMAQHFSSSIVYTNMVLLCVSEQRPQAKAIEHNLVWNTEQRPKK